MRYNELLELAGVKKFHNMTASEILDQFRSTFGNEPIKLLGQGSSGVALLIKNEVYKFWMIDSAYESFINYVKQHQDNPFLPQLKSNIKSIPAFFIRSEHAPDKVHYIKMERLSGMRQANQFIFYLNAEQYIDNPNDDGEYNFETINLGRVIYYLERIKDPKNAIEEFTNLISPKSQGITFDTQVLPDNLIQFINTMMDIRQLGFRLDLHDANFMMRNDQLVILDPLTNEQDLQLNLLIQKFDQKLWRDDNEGKQAIGKSKSPSQQPIQDNTTMDDLDDFVQSKLKAK